MQYFRVPGSMYTCTLARTRHLVSHMPQTINRKYAIYPGQRHRVYRGHVGQMMVSALSIYFIGIRPCMLSSTPPPPLFVSREACTVTREGVPSVSCYLNDDTARNLTRRCLTHHALAACEIGYHSLRYISMNSVKLTASVAVVAARDVLFLVSINSMRYTEIEIRQMDIAVGG